MNPLKSQAVLLTLIGLTTATFVVTTDLPHQDLVMSVFALILVGISLTMERIRPFDQNWNQNQGDTAGDAAMGVLLFGILDSILMWMTPFALLMILGRFASGTLAMPLWAEVICAGLLIEFGAYASHRLHHQSRLLWPLHAMHHSPTRLYTLNNFRFHPLNHLVNHAFMIVPAVLIGLSPQSILGYTSIVLPILLLQHTNVDFHFGWLNSFLNTNQVHRWHHSAAIEHRNCNLGRATVLFDRLFGTYYMAGPQASPESIGLATTTRHFPVPRRIFAQLCYPFGCCRTP